jgi:hypothetical protein
MNEPIPAPKAHQLVDADDEQQDPQHAQGAHSSPAPEADPTSPSTRSPSRRKAAGKRTYSRHGLTKLRKAVTELGTTKLDGRSRVAVAARRFKADLLADLGGNPSRAQETIAELAARQWVLLCSLDDWIARQPSLVTKKRTVLPVLMQRETIALNLLRLLTALGLERRAVPATDLATYLRSKANGGKSD